MGEHDGHRDRRRELFLRDGPEGFTDCQLLELLLFYAIPRSDTAPVAQALLDRFGALEGVLTAPAAELEQVGGVGAKTAPLIKLVVPVYQRALLSKGQPPPGEGPPRKPAAMGRFLRDGPEGFTDCELFQLLLTYAMPRIDTSLLATALIDTFGGLYAVLTTPVEKLAETVGRQPAALLRLIVPLAQRIRLPDPPARKTEEPEKHGLKEEPPKGQEPEGHKPEKQKPEKQKHKRKSQNSNIHQGHRDRKREQFLRSGPDSFADHELLELLLYYARPRIDTNGIAHGLINSFGSLYGVLAASAEELSKVEGVGRNTAALIKLIPPLFQRALTSNRQDTILDTTERLGQFFLNHFIDRPHEVMFIACLDAKGRLLGFQPLSEGGARSVDVSIRQIVEYALRYNAVLVALAHNHPSGLALPSPEDIETTYQIASALQTVNVILADHIVVADNDYVSMRQEGIIR